MSEIEGRYGSAVFIDDHIVYMRMNEGVEVKLSGARSTHRKIAEHMPGNYGILIDRVHDYSISPVELYEYLNSIENLKAIANVVYRENTKSSLATAERIFQGHFGYFSSVEEAHAWLNSVLTEE
ncbi:hypothetical protein [Aurantivibrio plasticivorans]